MTKIFVSDFDGTMTSKDFYELAIERLIPPGCPDFWSEYRAGRMTHFDALNAYFHKIRATMSEVAAVLDDMQLDPDLPSAVELLQKHDWQIVVTSAGCHWYIDRLLNKAGVQLEVHTNPGHFDEATGLNMELPTQSPFFSRELGIDKAGVVRHYLNEGRVVAFAGNGHPDAEAAKLVPEDRRFARGDLAKQLTSDGLKFQPYDRWADIARHLVDSN